MVSQKPEVMSYIAVCRSKEREVSNKSVKFCVGLQQELKRLGELESTERRLLVSKEKFSILM